MLLDILGPDGHFHYSKAQRSTLDAVVRDAEAKIQRALQRARCTATVTHYVKEEAEVEAEIKGSSSNLFNEKLASLSDFGDLVFFRVLVSSEKAVDPATDQIERLFERHRTYRRDLPNENGEDFRCHDVLLRYPLAINPDIVNGTLGLRVRVESRPFVEFEQRIEAERRDAARMVADEEQRGRLARQIQAAGRGAPRFSVRAARFHYQEQAASNDLRERKALVKERHVVLLDLCGTRSNEHPRLLQLADRYGKALRNLRKDRGAFRLFLSGLDMEGYVRVATAAPADTERNPPLDGDLLHTIESLIIAHAGLMALFPEVRQAAVELDVYRENAQAVDALRSRVFDPALARLSAAPGLLDDETAIITREVFELGDATTTLAATKGEQAVKHGWLRGLLGAIGQRVIAQTKAVGSDARSVVVKKGVEAAWQHRDLLTGAVIRFLETARVELLQLAAKFPVSFGWLKALYDLLWPHP